MINNWIIFSFFEYRTIHVPAITPNEKQIKHKIAMRGTWYLGKSEKS